MSKQYERVILTADMMNTARASIPDIRVYRTQASLIDTLAGALGEFAFAQWLTGDWKAHEVNQNKGAIDFRGIVEIKTSAFPFSESLNLLVREDYARKRHPPLYVQIIIDVSDPKAKDVLIGTQAVIAGFALGDEIANAPLKDFGSKLGGKGGYRCYYIMIRDLHPMKEFRASYDRLLADRDRRQTH